MFLNQVFNCRVFFVLNLLDGGSSFRDLLLPEHFHLVLVVQVDLVANTLEFIAGLRLLLIFLSSESVEVFFVADFLLLLSDVD